MALNPYPCGLHGDPVRACTCTAKQIARSRSRISGPLLDRIDIHIDVPRLPWKELAEAIQYRQLDRPLSGS